MGRTAFTRAPECIDSIQMLRLQSVSGKTSRMIGRVWSGPPDKSARSALGRMVPDGIILKKVDEASSLVADEARCLVYFSGGKASEPRRRHCSFPGYRRTRARAG